MSTHEFSQRRTFLGTLTGSRAFLVAENGVLTGVHHYQPFTTGENTAQCLLNDYSYFVLDIHPEGKPVACRDCTCGFYAYFDGGDNPHYFDPSEDTTVAWLYARYNVLALIEGYGVMTAGTRGFRCSKAKLRCLIEPPTGEGCIAPGRDYLRDLAGRLERTREIYRDVPWMPTLGAALAVWPLTPVEVVSS
jgi:hypothetical protein